MNAPVNLALLLQGTNPSSQLGYHSAFEDAVASGRLSGYRAFCYQQARTPRQWQSLWEDVIDHCVATEADVVFLQFFHLKGAIDPRPYLDRIRQLPKKPIIVTSCGDPFGPRREPPPKSLLRAASRSDLFLSTSMGRMARLAARAGSRYVALMANSACHIRHAPLQPTEESTPLDDSPVYDVVYIGRRHGGKNFVRGLYTTGKRRSEYVEKLAKRYGEGFALYGAKWPNSASLRGFVSFDEQVTAARSGRVVFGGYPASTLDYYHSDRVFIQNVSGRPMVEMRVPGIDRLFRDNEEWLLFDDFDDAIRKIDWLLDNPDRAREIGRNAAQAVRAKHLSTHRVELMITMFDELLKSRAVGRDPRCPPLDFLLPGQGETEIPSALGW